MKSIKNHIPALKPGFFQNIQHKKQQKRIGQHPVLQFHITPSPVDIRFPRRSVSVLAHRDSLRSSPAACGYGHSEFRHCKNRRPRPPGTTVLLLQWYSSREAVRPSWDSSGAWDTMRFCMTCTFANRTLKGQGFLT